MEVQIPRGPKHLKCPFWQKAMSQVCHTCPMWVCVRGKSSNKEDTYIDNWSCSFRFMPELTVAMAQTNREATAAAEGVRNVLTSIAISKATQERIANHNSGVAQLGKPTAPRD